METVKISIKESEATNAMAWGFVRKCPLCGHDIDVVQTYDYATRRFLLSFSACPCFARRLRTAAEEFQDPGEARLED